jgi:peptidoglycan/LPS O-acetylase OafA/YrhL
MKISLGHEQYPALTGVRALAAAAIFYDHFYAGNATVVINTIAFFFVMSGFVIVRVYYSVLDRSWRWVRNYFVKRIARLYPLYFLLLTIAVILSKESFSSLVIVRNYTLTQAFFNAKDVIIQPCWSLTVEECFYFLAPLIVIFIKRYNFITSMIIGIGSLAGALGIAMLDLPFLNNAQFIFTTTFMGHFLEFYTGVFLALLVIKKEKAHYAVNGKFWTTTGLLCCAVILAAMAYTYQQKPLNVWAIVTLNNFLMPFAAGALYFGFVFEKSMLRNLLSSKFMGLLGRSSYAFYIGHMLVIMHLSRPFLLPYMNRELCLALTYLITLLMAIAVFIFFEEPLNIFLRKRLMKRSDATDVPVWLPATNQVP